jgi:murein L,D-transpeptidase YcbB/YkuD
MKAEIAEVRHKSMSAWTSWRRICLLWFVAANSLFAAAPADSEGVAAAISAELDALMSPDVTTIHGAHIAMTDRLHAFYSRREFRAAWTSVEAQRQLIQALADSYADGLDPADYHLPLLRKLATQVTAPNATDTLKARYDVLLTESLLRFAYHLAFGKVAAIS